MNITNKVILLSGSSPLHNELYSWLNSHRVQIIGLTDLPAYKDRIDLALEVSNLDLEEKKETIQYLDSLLSPNIPILSTSLAITATEIASWTAAPERVCGFGTFVPLLERELIEIAPALQTSSFILEQVVDFIQSQGKETEVVEDEVGLVFPRVLSLIINEAIFTMMEGTATAQDIDTAMKKGTNYPYGPLEWADRIGLDEVYAVIKGLHQNLGEERYRPAPLLRKLVLAGRIGRRSGQGIYSYEKQEV